MKQDCISKSFSVSKSANSTVTASSQQIYLTYTQIIGALSKKILHDALEFKFAALWGIEDEDFVLLPSLTWTKDKVSVGFSVGIFGGDEKGQFGQG